MPNRRSGLSGKRDIFQMLSDRLRAAKIVVVVYKPVEKLFKCRSANLFNTDFHS